MREAKECSSFQVLWHLKPGSRWTRTSTPTDAASSTAQIPEQNPIS